MPTLQSVNVHPQLCAKLATDVTPPITTPLALLSRDAATTAQQLNVPLALWNQVRSAVADALLVQCSSRTIIRIAETATDTKTTTDTATATATTNTTTTNTADARRSEKSLMVGSISALDYWNHLQTLPQYSFSQNANNHPLTPWFVPQAIFQLTGAHASGKTQVCLDMAIRFLAAAAAASSSSNNRHVDVDGDDDGGGCCNHKVCYLTSTTPPATLARRLRQLAAAAACSSHSNPKVLLQNIDITPISTPYELLSKLEQLLSTLEEQESTRKEEQSSFSSSSPRLLVILDSASGCLGGGGGDRHEWNLLQRVGTSLRQLVQWHHGVVQVICTNGISSSGAAALGQVWNSSVAQIQVKLQIIVVQEEGEGSIVSHKKLIQATLERHVNKEEGEKIHFWITANGIEAM